MPHPALSAGSISSLLADVKVEQPVLQMIGFKKVTGGVGDRYRTVISDGRHHFSMAMLGTQHNHRIESGELDKLAVFRLDQYVVNTICADRGGGRKVISILDLTILASGKTVGTQIGNPEPMVDGANTGNAPKQDMGGSHAKTVPGMRVDPVSSSGNQNRVVPSIKQESNFPTSASNRMQGFGNRPGTSAPTETRTIHPISSLTPYQNRWTIKARVTNKSSVKTWSNSRGEGKLFSLDLIDESGEIRATAFNEQCDKFYEAFEMGQAYYISRCQLKGANRKFTSIKNDYEMTFTNDTTVEPCRDDKSLPAMNYNFIQIKNLQNIEKDTYVDVIGVCKRVGELQTLTSRTNNKELKKRDLNLIDKSNAEIVMTLWGEDAEKFAVPENCIIAIKSARLSDFGGRSLSGNASAIQIDPKVAETSELKTWFIREGTHTELVQLSGKGGSGAFATPWKTLGEVKTGKVGIGDKPDYYNVKAYTLLVRTDNSMYQACPSEDCNKKLIDQGNGVYRCEKCSQDYMNFKWRFLASVNIADFSGNQWVTCFQEVAETLLGKSADEMGQLKMQDEAAFQNVFNRANFKQHTFKVRTKMETYRDENRLKSTVVSVGPVDHVEHNKRLIAEIKAMTQ